MREALFRRIAMIVIMILAGASAFAQDMGAYGPGALGGQIPTDAAGMAAAAAALPQAPAAQSPSIQSMIYDQTSLTSVDLQYLENEYTIYRGDTFKLVLWGRIQKTYVFEVPLDGWIFLEDLNPIQAIGKTLSQFRKEVGDAVNANYKNPAYNLSLQRMHPITVKLVGVMKTEPGRYSFGRPLRVSEMFQMMGGLPPEGSKRGITILRKTASGTKTLEVNLFEIMNGIPDAFDPYIQTDDIISVPLVTKRVYLRGAVSKRGVYEIKDGEKIADLLRLAAGPTPEADQQKAFIKRGNEKILFDMYRLLHDNDESQNITLKDEDLVYVPEKLSLVYVIGNVKTPSRIAYQPHWNVIDYINEAGGTIANAKLKASGIFSVAPDKTMKLKRIDLESIYTGKASVDSYDVQPGDIIIIPNKTKVRLNEFIGYLFTAVGLRSIVDN